MTALITDIDGTLVGDPDDLAGFNEFIGFYRARMFLVYATGRDMEEYRDVFIQEELIEPDAAIINTGADIYLNNNDRYEHMQEWHDRTADPGWDAKKVMDTLKKTGLITLQDKRDTRKVSYFTVPGREIAAKNNVVEILAKAGIKAKVIISHGKFLDILPEKCDKGEAAAYLVDRQNISREKTVVAGDSENDLDLFVKFKNGIIVGNALEGLKKGVANMGFYHAKSCCAAGLVEGIKYYIGKGIFF